MRSKSFSSAYILTEIVRCRSLPLQIKIQTREQSCAAEAGPGTKSKRAGLRPRRHEPTPRARFSSLLHFLITKTLVSSDILREATGFVSDFLSPGRQSVPGLGRAILSYGLRPRHTRGITYAGRWFLSPPLHPTYPLSVPPHTDSLPGYIRFLASPLSCCITSERRPEPKKLGAPSTSARVLLPVAHPKNIPRLIQPPCAALINNVHSGSPPDSSTTCGVSADDNNRGC